MIIAVAARFAAGADPVERAIACAVLAIELGAAGYAVAASSAPRLVLVGAIGFRLIAIAFATCWPARRPARSLRARRRHRHRRAGPRLTQARAHADRPVRR